jgi:hypothetical protein
MLSSSFDQPAIAVTLQATSIEPHSSTKPAGADAAGEGRVWFGPLRGKPSALRKIERRCNLFVKETAVSQAYGLVRDNRNESSTAPVLE